MHYQRRTILAFCLATAWVIGGSMTGGTPAAFAVPSTVATTYSFTSAGCSIWNVPAGWNAVQIAAMGAAGGNGALGTGGAGDGYTAVLSGLSGGTLDVCVNQGGAAGGAAAASGGGASGVSLGSDFSRPVLVAAGGGGASRAGAGGSAGHGGATFCTFDDCGVGGGAGTTTSGGAGGGHGLCANSDANPSAATGSNGTGFTVGGPGAGGAGGAANIGGCGSFSGGGGGGGGYYGGGGGGARPQAGGGGGGSDYCADPYTGGTSIAGCTRAAGAGIQTAAGNGVGYAHVTISFFSVAFATAGCSTWTVPSGLSSLQMAATGAAGGSFFLGSGGAGDGYAAVLSGLSGGSLYACVDQGGGAGGAAAGNGGGASGVSLGGDFSSPVLVAAGGGGGSNNGANGGAAGHAGSDYINGFAFAAGGGAGGLSAGGAGGGFGSSCAGSRGGDGAQFTASGPGAGGTGGAATFVCNGNRLGGGGGGGGYYGGGGGGAGAAGAGGGGGSDYCADPYTGGTSISGCTQSAGAGTQTAAGSGTGYAQVGLSNPDTTPPTTTATATAGSNPYTSNTWSVVPVSVVLGATDNTGGSGVLATYYQILTGNSACPPAAADGSGGWSVYTGNNFSFSSDGISTLCSFSIDGAGNLETPNRLLVKVDGTKPGITGKITGTTGTNQQGVGQWYTSAVTTEFDCSDATSGLQSGAAGCTDNGPNPQTSSTASGEKVSETFSNDTNGTPVTGTATDNAGNTRTAALNVLIDTHAPTATESVTSPASPSGTDAKGNVWYNTPVTITWTCDDPFNGVLPPNVTPGNETQGSGVAACSPDQNNQHTFSTDGAGQTEGITASDNAGNTTPATSDPINLDSTAPATTLDTSGAPTNAVTLKPGDTLSGVASTDFIVYACNASGQDCTGLCTSGGSSCAALCDPTGGPCVSPPCTPSPSTTCPGTQTGTTIDFPNAGTFLVQYWSVDYAGNMETPHTTTMTYAAPGISPQPVGTTVAPGAPFTLTVGATGIPDPSYQWYYSPDGQTFSKIDGATSDSYTNTASTSTAGQYYVVASNGVGQDATSNTVSVLLSQSITFSLSNPTYGQDVPLSATASSNLPVTYHATGACQITSGSTLHPTGTGACTVTASQTGTTQWAPATAKQMVTVQPATPTFTFDLSKLPAKSVQAAPFSVASYVTTNSPGAVSFRLGNGSTGCTVTSAGMVTITGAGTCVLQATLAATTNYSGAGPRSQSFAIIPPGLTLTSNGPAGTTGYAITLSPNPADACTGGFAGSSISGNLAITGYYYGSTVYFLVTYAKSTSWFAGTLTGRPGAWGSAGGSGKDSGGITRTYVATSPLLFQAHQLGCQDATLTSPSMPLTGARAGKSFTAVIGTVGDPDGFSSLNPDLTVTVSFGDGSSASCTGSACFASSASPVRLVGCQAAPTPALPGGGSYPGAPLDTSCQVQIAHTYAGAATDTLTLTVTDRDQTSQPLSVNPSIVVGP